MKRMNRMIRFKKWVAMLLVVLFLLPCMSDTAEAATGATGKWKKDSGGYRYVYSDGSYAKAQWLTVNKKKYYVKKTGYRVTGWAKIDKKQYFFTADGVMKTGWLKKNGKTYYFRKTGVMATGNVMIDGIKYSFTSTGALKSQAATFPKNFKVGDVIKFGHYEQDTKTTNGKEPIEWIVLEKQANGGYLLVSRYGLDAQPYNESLLASTWEKCSLRKWLNKDFYNAAFTAEEKTKIRKATVVNNDNFFWGTEGGKNTKDKLFLLSDDEAKKFFRDDNGQYAGGDSHSRACRMTKYTISQGAWELKHSEWWAKNCWYWLRSPGMYGNYASYVFRNGYVSYDYDGIDYLKGVVRPAMVYVP